MNICETQFRRYRRQAFLLVGIWILAAGLLWGFLLHGYFAPRIGWRLSLTILFTICIVPVFHVKLWRFFTDRSFTGTVLSVRHKETLTSPKNDPRPTATVPLYHIYLTVQTESGTIKKHIESLEPLYHDLWYRTGDRVIYHRGTMFPLIVGGRDVCAYCGHEFITDSRICRDCGMESPPITDAPQNDN